MPGHVKIAEDLFAYKQESAGTVDANTEVQMIKEDFFKNWNYKKHAKFCTAVYLGLYTFDMTISYFIVKKLLKKYYA